MIGASKSAFRREPRQRRFSVNVSKQTKADFCAWIVAQGFVYQGKGSPLRFFQSFEAGEWGRKALAPPVPEAPGVVGADYDYLTIEESAHAFISQGLYKHFRSWEQFIADLAAGHWARLPAKPEPVAPRRVLAAGNGW